MTLRKLFVVSVLVGILWCHKKNKQTNKLKNGSKKEILLELLEEFKDVLTLGTRNIYT